MGLSKKHKRKITCLNQQFYWWVLDSHEDSEYEASVNIALEDKSFLVKYYLESRTLNRFIIVIGNNFPGLTQKNKARQRFICPDFMEDANYVAPTHIEKMILWCFDQDKELIPVNYKGEKF